MSLSESNDDFFVIQPYARQCNDPKCGCAAVWCRCVLLHPTLPVASRQAAPSTRGLSVKIPNNSNKSFSHLLRSPRALPSTFRTSLQRFFQFCKHSWNAYFGTLRSSASDVSLISSTHFNRRHFSMDFSLVKERVRWCKVCEYGGWGTSVV